MYISNFSSFPSSSFHSFKYLHRYALNFRMLGIYVFVSAVFRMKAGSAVFPEETLERVPVFGKCNDDLSTVLFGGTVFPPDKNKISVADADAGH